MWAQSPDLGGLKEGARTKQDITDAATQPCNLIEVRVMAAIR